MENKLRSGEAQAGKNVLRRDPKARRALFALSKNGQGTGESLKCDSRVPLPGDLGRQR
jgi:hypothetical protein